MCTTKSLKKIKKLNKLEDLKKQKQRKTPKELNIPTLYYDASAFYHKI